MSIAVNTKKDVFLLSTKSTSYAFGVDDRGLIRHLYWGKKLDFVEELELPQLTEVSTNDPVFEVTKDGLLMTEINPEFTVDDVKAATAAPFAVAADLKSMID